MEKPNRCAKEEECGFSIFGVTERCFADDEGDIEGKICRKDDDCKSKDIKYKCATV